LSTRLITRATVNIAINDPIARGEITIPVVNTG
jgi:hypothetical protein